MPNIIRASLLALATSAVLSAPASAEIKFLKNTSFSASDSYLGNPPALVFVPKNGKSEMEKPETYTIKLHLKAQKKWNARIVRWSITETSAAAGGGRGVVASNGFQNTSLKKLNKTINYKVGWNELKHFEAKGRKACEQHGKPDEKVVKNPADVFLMLSAFVRAETKHLSENWEWLQGVPIRVVCMPEPFAVNDVKLSVKFNGSPLSCPVKATLKAEFKGNKPGTFKFRIFRGDGATQDVTRTIGNAGKVSFTKHYTFNKSTDRKYLVAVIGHPIATQWVPMKVHCGKKVGGFKAPTKPHTTY